MQAQIPLTSHIVSRQRVGVDPAKTEPIENWLTPANVKDVHAVLGLGLRQVYPRLFNSDQSDVTGSRLSVG